MPSRPYGTLVMPDQSTLHPTQKEFIQNTAERIAASTSGEWKFAPFIDIDGTRLEVHYKAREGRLHLNSRLPDGTTMEAGISANYMGSGKWSGGMVTKTLDGKREGGVLPGEFEGPAEAFKYLAINCFKKANEMKLPGSQVQAIHESNRTQGELIMPSSELNLGPGCEVKKTFIRPGGTKIYFVSGNITDATLDRNPETEFLFGDNVEDRFGGNDGRPRAREQRDGIGGQAGAMAGKANAMGIPTLWCVPGLDETRYQAKYTQGPYFNDGQLDQVKMILDKAFAEIPQASSVVILCDSNGVPTLGRGVANLSNERTPQIWSYLEQKIEALKGLQLVA